MKARHFWLRNAAGFPVACIASTLMPDSTIAVAISIVNPIDVFDRARGREIALARLEKNKLLFYVAGANPKWTILDLINTCPELPKRVRDAAKLWLDAHPIPETPPTPPPLNITIGPGVEEAWNAPSD